jgi:hypothetical protein
VGGVDAGLVLAGGQGVEGEDEAVTLVGGVAFGGHVRARRVGGGGGGRPPVEVEMDFDAAAGVALVHDPAAHALRVDVVERALEGGAEGRVVKARGQRADEEEVEGGLRQQEVDEAAARARPEGRAAVRFLRAVVLLKVVGARAVGFIRNGNTEAGLVAPGLRVCRLPRGGVGH